MNEMRKQLVDKAFAKLDKTGDGVVTIDDLKGVYNVKQSKEYLNGQKTEDQLLTEFLRKFEEGSPDGMVSCWMFVEWKEFWHLRLRQLTRDEFYDYYSGISASIDNDMYFDLMMRHAWKLWVTLSMQSTKQDSTEPKCPFQQQQLPSLLNTYLTSNVKLTKKEMIHFLETGSF